MIGEYSGGFLSTAMPFMLIAGVGLLLLLFDSVRDGLKSGFHTIVEDVTGLERPLDDMSVLQGSEEDTSTGGPVPAGDEKSLAAEREALGLPDGWATPRTRAG